MLNTYKYKRFNNNHFKNAKVSIDSDFDNDGNWIDGIWIKGIFDGVQWENGIWLDGTWVEGDWFNGVWKKGHIRISNNDYHCGNYVSLISPKCLYSPESTLSLNHANYI